MKKRITILLPTLNEEEAIGKVIDDIPLDELQSAGYDVEVLVIDGGSSDRTLSRAAEKGAITASTARGYGRQYRAGFQKARGDIIVTADSDGSYPLEDALSLIRMLEHEQLDFITTNRFAALERGAMHPVNHVGNFLLTLLVNVLFGLPLKDSQSGMWIIRKSALGRLNLTGNGMPLSEEIKIEAFEKLRAREVDSRYKKRIGKIKLKRMRDGWENLVHLVKMKRERVRA